MVEVREGQQTDMFDKFPYEQVKEQSFSLMYMKEGGCTVSLELLYPACNPFSYVAIIYYYIAMLVLNFRQAVCIPHIAQSHL